MRVISLYTHGMTMGTSPVKNDHQRAKRSEVSGWSSSATRRNIAFLRSVDVTDLSGKGIALTLTIKNCPETPDSWHSLRNAFIKRLKRLGLIRFHWVTEWQRRGVPHLHGAFWFPGTVTKAEIIRHWLQVAQPYTATSGAQHACVIDNAIGWFKYLSKHAARGVSHYQRSSDNIPEKWKSKTGRMWGYGGDWRVIEPAQIRLNDDGYYRLRRIIRNWRVADAREFPAVTSFLYKNPQCRPLPDILLRRLSGASRRLSHSRRMLKSNCRTVSDVRGISEWIDESVLLSVLGYLSETGSIVSS